MPQNNLDAPKDFKLRITTQNSSYESPLEFPEYKEGQRVKVLTEEPATGKKFLNWLSGFQDCNHCELFFSGAPASIQERQKTVARLYKPAFGKTLHEIILFQTEQNCKDELFRLVDELYGPELRNLTDPKQPLFSKNKSEPLQMDSLLQTLTARSLLEISQINLLLRKPKVIVINESSGLLKKAALQGFKISPELMSLNSIFFVCGDGPLVREYWQEKDYDYTISLERL